MDVIPDDVLRVIFNEYVQSKYGRGSFPFPGYEIAPKVAQYDIINSNTPFRLGRVCSRWRALTEDTPQLWTAICIPSAKRPGMLELFELWLKRSGKMPITLILNLMDGEWKDFQKSIVEQAFKESERWQRVNLQLGGGPTQLESIPWQNAKTPELEFITLRLPGWTSKSVGEFLDALGSNSKIRGVEFNGYFPVPQPVRIPDVNLKVLRLHGFKCYEIYSYLGSSHAALEELAVDDIYCCVFPYTAHPRMPFQIRINTLKTLSIRVTAGLPQYLPDIVAPNLENLYLDVVERNEQHLGQFWTILQIFGKHSNCKLKSFRFPGGFEHQVTGASWSLPMFSQLRDLEIRAPVGLSTLEHLTFTKERKLLPELERLVITDCRATNGVLANMIKSRTSKLRDVLKPGEKLEPKLKVVDVKYANDGWRNCPQEFALVDRIKGLKLDIAH
ncbi:hypothetical protein CC1G_12845 [Coprinopsis cinerea okayama7|uniref:Uncharacterized protein n=1 Tax=Coprinopsis cinerea (strain Okayama-7 / 130 / ATCC MYA-4618 / FGSC 9003) TaxID=240176 RepID=A8NE15_COPC7|nr:hypothetical protein CC1G_12845 [Coprinopsis cinerea okayama7\|eukprot:XP_001832917.2 hypothetical protein CC1G_12845 [Coprinopsis cinerea okayama7\